LSSLGALGGGLLRRSARNADFALGNIDFATDRGGKGSGSNHSKNNKSEGVHGGRSKMIDAKQSRQAWRIVRLPGSEDFR
jgi:hypothetical protein